jgi:O-antigen ligase
MIAIIASICTLLVLGALLFSVECGILLAFLFKPIIDASWEANIAGVNNLQIVGGLFPLIVFLHIIVKKGRDFLSCPLIAVWSVYFLSSIISFVVMMSNGNYTSAIEINLRIFNGFVGYFMLQIFLNDRESFRKLLIAIIFAGCFPVVVGLYQAATGVVWRERYTVGLLRNVGLYHDAFSIRSYVCMTITSIILYCSYFCDKNKFKRIALFVYALASIFIVYKIYSKAAFIIAFAWALIWCFFRRKIIMVPILLLAVLAVNFISDGIVFDQVSTLFSKETAAIDGTGPKERALAGRAYLWNDILERWDRADVVEKIVGVGMSAAFHNDYLRAMMTGGYLGLAVYVSLLIAIGFRIMGKLYQSREPINVVALMIFAMWIIDTIGLTPSIYPAYQWYVWGFIGLALRGVKGLNEHESNRNIVQTI